MRKSTLFLFYLTLNIVLVCLMVTHAYQKQRMTAPILKEKATQVKELALTDLCLFTEARYTRHPNMADLNTPFQDFPMSIEHYPSGSLMLPPPQFKGAF